MSLFPEGPRSKRGGITVLALALLGYLGELRYELGRVHARLDALEGRTTTEARAAR